MDTINQPPRPRSKLFRATLLGKEKDTFVDNLSMMLASGIPILQAVAALKREARSKRFLAALEGLEEDVGNGLPLWQAFSRSGLLPEYAVSLIRIGEQSGRLTENLKVITLQQQKDRTLKERIHSAMIYPMLVLGLSAVIGLGVAWFILPRLAAVFVNLRLKLPWPTRLLMAIGGFLSHWGAVVVPAATVILAVIFYIIFVFPKTKFLGQKFLFLLPAVRGLIMEVELSRFGYVFGTLLSAGVPVVEAMGLMAEVSTFVNYRHFFYRMRAGLEEGDSFQKIFHNHPGSRRLIPSAIQQMIISGEQSGRLEETLVAVAKNFEDKSETTTKNLSVILEPILLVIVWLGVALVAVAVIMPVYNLVGGLENQVEPSSAVTPAASQRPISLSGKPAGLGSPPLARATSSLPQAEVLSGRLEATSTFSFINVRAAPAQTSAVVAKIYPGKIYNFTKQQDNWYFISLPNNKSGWVFGNYVQLFP